jgi:hypothetical protein
MDCSFQQDGVTWHITHATMEMLEDPLSVPISFPAKCLKTKNNNQLKVNTETTIWNNDEVTLRKVTHNMVTRVQQCREEAKTPLPTFSYFRHFFKELTCFCNFFNK